MAAAFAQASAICARGGWAASVLLLLACACPDPALERGRALQRDVRRAIIETRSLGRYGTFALLQERIDELPCRVPVGTDNDQCELRIVGKGAVRLRASPPDVVAVGAVPADVPVEAVYAADCSLEPFDRKTFDQVLPRTRSEQNLSVWEDDLLRVTHRRLAGERNGCEVRVEVAPALLARLTADATDH